MRSEFNIPVSTDEIESRLTELHCLLLDGTRFVPMNQTGRWTAMTSEGHPVSAFAGTATRWTLCGGVLHVCRDHPRKYTLEEALFQALCLANDVTFMSCGPLVSLQMWEINEGHGRAHEEVTGLLSTTLAYLRAGRSREAVSQPMEVA